MKFREIALTIGLCTAVAAGVSAPAEAAAPAPVAVTVAQAGPLPIPTTLLSSDKFWPYATNGSIPICVAVGDAYAPIAKMAQAWNNATNSLALSARANCITAGYTPSLRMTIDTYSAQDGQCTKLTNTYISQADSFHRWTGNPLNVVGWVNTYYEGCYSTSLLRDKWTAIAIGQVLGAKILYGQQWAGRGMGANSPLYGPSRNTDGATIDNLYYEFYEGIYG